MLDDCKTANFVRSQENHGITALDDFFVFQCLNTVCNPVLKVLSYDFRASSAKIKPWHTKLGVPGQRLDLQGLGRKGPF
jgi:hypothetical protein